MAEEGGRVSIEESVSKDGRGVHNFECISMLQEAGGRYAGMEKVGNLERWQIFISWRDEHMAKSN